MAAARGMPIPPPDEIPLELEYKNPPKKPAASESSETQDVQHLTVPIGGRSLSANSGTSQSSVPANSLPSASPIASGTSSSPLFRTRAKTLAALTTSKLNSQTDLTPRELQLPRDPFVNGQPIEAYLYKDASECPICFLYYPPYLNRTRCCDQPICSECFVQIKRPDPHPPDHGDNDPNAPPPSAERGQSEDGQLVMEPAACPFCVQPELGVTYAAPPFRRGLSYVSDPSGRHGVASPMSSTSSLSSGNFPPTGRRRATSLSASDPNVITTDRIRPDWSQKLANARAHAARRSAAATALHTAAYVVNSNQSGGESRISLGRRGVMRRAGVDSQNSSGRGSPALNALAFLSERRGQGQEAGTGEGEDNLAGPRDSSRRRRVHDLEEMMMMEAIRLSLASEEERRKKEVKDMRKEAKRTEKEAKKADKAARKNGLYSNNASSSGLDAPPKTRKGRVASDASSVANEEASSAGKGKGVERISPSTAAATDSDSGAAPGNAGPVPPSTGVKDFQPVSSGLCPAPTEANKPSHLRQVSSASSSHSSGSDDRTVGPDGNTSSTEPMFNFRSLAEVIGDEEKGDEAEHVERTSSKPDEEGSASTANAYAYAHAHAHAPSPEQQFVDCTESPATSETKPAQNGHGDGVRPKELEARSVEITSPGHAEAPS